MKVYLNGVVLRADEARVSPFDRAYLFGDGVYEGLRSFGGRVVGLGRHADRMQGSLAALRIDWDAGALGSICDHLLEANRLADAFIYVQVSRGAPAPGQPRRSRVHKGPIQPGVFAFCYPTVGIDACAAPDTQRAAVVQDTRWTRGRIKSLNLLGSVLAAYEAADAGADEAILVRDGMLTESATANVILATPGGETCTPSLESGLILAGVTRAMLLEAADEIVERPVRAEELMDAAEIMLVGTSRLLSAVAVLDGRPVGDGRVGPVARRLHAALLRATKLDVGLE